jgi:arylsulfatase
MPCNILFFLTDQQRADSLGCMGNPVCETPNLDRLAATGALFTNHHVNNPVCMPSRATLWTGQTPRGHGVRCNGIPLDLAIPTLPGILADAGYSTFNAGKVHLQPTQDSPGVDPAELPPELAVENRSRWRLGINTATPGGYYGFQRCETTLGHGPSIEGDYGQWLRREHPDALDAHCNRQGYVIAHPDMPQCYSWAIPQELHHSWWVADRTIDFLEAQQGASKPFFAVCSFPDPHHPFVAPKPWCDKYDRSRVPMPVRREGELERMPPHYPEHAATSPVPGRPGETQPMTEEHLRECIALTYGAVSFIDHNVGRVLDRLDELGMAENTIVVFTSDHGELLGDHGLMRKGPFLYRSLTRVPLIVRHPEGRPGTVCDSIASHLDIAPTLLDCAGVDYPDRDRFQTQGEGGEPPALPGRSIKPLLTGEAASTRERALVEFDRDRMGMRLRSLVTERFRVTIYSGEPYGELFDLEHDPDELHNLWDEPSAEDLKALALSSLLAEEVATESTLPRRRTCW